MDCPGGTCALPSSTREEKRKEYETDPANAQETWENLRNAIGGIGRGYFSDDFAAAEIESQLHDIWDELIHAAKITPATSAELDRLVTLVSETRALGVFAQNKADKEAAPEREGATLPNGQKLWIDLPYLGQEVKDSWTKESMGFTPAERESLAVWAAKLCATCICPEDLSRCALWLFKQALETDRPVTKDGQDGKACPTVHDLLPACLAWLKHSNSKLVRLSYENYRAARASEGGISSEENNDSSITLPGDLAVQAGVTQPGFSIDRWLFWRQRFKDLYRSGVPSVVKLARSCFEVAIFSGMDVGLDIPGERVYLSRLFEALDREVETREFKECVGAEDIDIDMDWDKE
ncbi:hypothetical protein MGYG_05152 [Nannizzia gypsea CBS 118893]|uniref:Uncharacterized protein n=1 Tax=Arthroderma gypseum (strain ATCC MYA-4604 / CBS 118893) TaxID=535722 RepID=E4UYI7_ARTGP|nr:hypothetical protein MGYG_05152 [Nannizzia gypsea CBS 118893]EFR02150.1 hypothetical protein MGYG_05152 [Nannizzia gypsea CBS 118893]